jgi:hypothetical protein
VHVDISNLLGRLLAARSVETFFHPINVKSLLCVPFGFEFQIPSFCEGKFCLAQRREEDEMVEGVCVN